MLSVVLLAFVPVFAVVITVLLLVNRYFSARQKSVMAGALREAGPAAARQLVPILMAPGEISFSRLVERVNLSRKLELHMRQAGLSSSPAGVFSVMGICAVAGAILGTRLHVLLYPALSSLALAGVMGLAPLIPILYKRRKRFGEFEKQLPDALDFLARAMRAGHAFTVSLKIMADESPDPLGQEFRKLCAEHNLGGSLPDALQALLLRIPMLDLQFFAAAVNLQRQTGGNLSEVLLRLSQVIRERFMLRGKVKAASAHGRMTGLVLTAMPLVVGMFMMMTSPDYLLLLKKDPMGRYMILGSLMGQVAGYICIRKITDFEV